MPSNKDKMSGPMLGFSPSLRVDCFFLSEFCLRVDGNGLLGLDGLFLPDLVRGGGMGGRDPIRLGGGDLLDGESWLIL